MSKGDTRRPRQISQAEMDRRWEMAFGSPDDSSDSETPTGESTKTSEEASASSTTNESLPEPSTSTDQTTPESTGPQDLTKEETFFRQEGLIPADDPRLKPGVVLRGLVEPKDDEDT